MKKILILANNDVGLYKFRKELIEELLKQFEVHISLPYGEFVDELVEMGCNFIDTKISRRGTNPVEDLKLMNNYRKIIRKVQPHLILSYTIKPNVYGGMLCRLMKIPFIPNVTGFGTAVENGGLLQKVTILLYRFGLERASCVFFQNKKNAEFAYRNNIVKGKYEILPGSGVNLEYFDVLDYPSGIDFNFLFIARIMKQKGIDQYLEAAKFIKKKYANVNFHILGFCEENYEEKILSMQHEGIVRYHGMQSDIKKFHRISHCTIHPTYYPEGMSNVLLESAACGRPVITTDKTGCKEIVDDGINGYLIEQKNTTSLISSIEKFINLSHREKKEMGIAGRLKVEREFDRKIIVDAYLKEIKYHI